MNQFKLSDIEEDLKQAVNDHIKLFSLIEDHIRIVIFDDKEHIVNAYTPLTNLYLLIDGKAKISILHEDGHRSIVYFVKPNEMIGELTLIGIEKQTKDVIAIGSCICLSVPMAIAKLVLLSNPPFLLLLNKYIGEKLLDRTWFNAKQQHYDLKHRLAAHILLCETGGLYDEKHTVTAEYLAVSYRHLLFTMKNFKDEGLITKGNLGYTFNRGALEELASVLK